MPLIAPFHKPFFTVITVVALAALASASSLANNPTKHSAYSPDIHLNHVQKLVDDEDAAFDFGSGLSLVHFGDLPDAADVDAVHGLVNGDVLFSLESSIVLGGTLYRPYDVIRFDGSTWSKELDGRAAGIPDGVNVDAIAMSGETLLLSLDVDAQLGATTVNDSDVLAFDGNDFSIFLDASITGIEAASDIDALHVDDQGRVLVSLDGTGELGGIHYRDEDLLAWESPDWSMEFDGSADDVAWQPADLDAWSIVFFNDNIFSDGFE
jgi:hypothetical protein